MRCHRRSFAAVVLLAFLPGLTACGPTKLHDGSADAVAVVDVHRQRRRSGAPGDVTFRVRLIGFDDRAVTETGPKVEVLPGRHRFRLAWTRYEFVWIPAFNFHRDETQLTNQTGQGVKTVTLDAEPGVRYRLRAVGGRTGTPVLKFVVR